MFRNNISNMCIFVLVLFTITTVNAISVSNKAQFLATLADKNTAIRCEVDMPRGDCRSCLNVPHCGYCADDDSCHIGKQEGPMRDIDCKSWHFSKCDAMPKCEAMTSCDECLAHPRCGWCHTEDPTKISCMPAVVGSDHSFRRNRKCQFGAEEKNLWFHTFLTDKRNISKICEGHLPRKQAIDKLAATTYWKGLSTDKSKVEEMRKKALKAQEGDALRLRNAKKRALEAAKEAKKLESDLANSEKELDSVSNDATSIKQALTLKTNKLTQEDAVLSEKKEKYSNAQKKLESLKAELATAEGNTNRPTQQEGDTFLEMSGATVDELKEKILDQNTTVRGLRLQVAEKEKTVNGLKEEVKELETKYADTSSKLETITKKVKLTRAQLIVAKAELHAAEGVVSSEKSLANEKGGTRKAASREVSANTIAQQQKNEDIEIRMRLDKAAIADMKVKNTINQQLKKLGLLKDMLQRKYELDESTKKMIENATEHLEKHKLVVAKNTKALEHLKEKIKNMTDNATIALQDVVDQQKSDVSDATKHPENPVQNDKNIEVDNKKIGEAKEELAFIKSSGKENITAAEGDLAKDEERLNVAKSYLKSQMEQTKKMREEFVASEKQQKSLEKANSQSNKNEANKLKQDELALAKEQKAADEQEAEAVSAMDNQAKEIANDADDAIKAAEKKTQLDVASAAKLLANKKKTTTNETQFEEEAKEAAQQLDSDATESEHLAALENDKAGVQKLPNKTNTPQVTTDNEMAKKFQKYKSKFEMSASRINELINDAKLALQKIRKMKLDAENKTAINAANEMAKIVLNECTDGERILENELVSLAKLHKERVDSAKDMHTRAEKQLGPVSNDDKIILPTKLNNSSTATGAVQF